MSVIHALTISTKNEWIIDYYYTSYQSLQLLLGGANIKKNSTVTFNGVYGVASFGHRDPGSNPCEDQYIIEFKSII